MTCPICKKRSAKRFCPAKGEKICAVCCGTEREVTIDCPSDCTYLIAARRYEQEHRAAPSASEMPYPDVEFPMDLVYERQPVLGGLALTILELAAANRMLDDAAIFEALNALAETYRTLGTGIYYERPPEASLPQTLYRRLAEFLQNFKKEEAQRTGFARLKDSEVFYLLVFLLTMGRYQTNGRPRSRAFLDFLRAHFLRGPQRQTEVPRIIVP